MNNYYGNLEILKLHKTAFFCSRSIAASAVLKCYDWALSQREAGSCIISGFHSQIEKDVLHYLLKGKQPIIIVLARSLKAKPEPELIKPLEDGRLLLVSPFNNTVKRITQETAKIRNQLMLEMAQDIVVGYAAKGGNLDKLLANTNKPIKYL